MATHHNHNHNIISTGRGGAGNMIEAKVSAATSVGTGTSIGGMHSDTIDSAANEVILTQEEWEAYSKSKSGMRRGSSKGNQHRMNTLSEAKIDEEIEKGREKEKERGKGDDIDRGGGVDHSVFASSGRGGVGNMTKTSRPLTAKVTADTSGMELSPVFSTGRGGAGNIFKTRSHGAVKAPNIQDEVSPVHSGIPPKGFSKKIGNNNNNNNNIENGDDEVVLDALAREKKGNRIMSRLRGLFK